MERELIRTEFDEGFEEITTKQQAEEIVDNCVYYTMKEIGNPYKGHWLLINEKDLALAIVNTPINYEATALRKKDLIYIASVSGGYLLDVNVSTDKKENRAFIKKVQQLQKDVNTSKCPCMDENSPLNPANY